MIKDLKDIEELFPLCKENNPVLFEEVAQHLLIMGEVSQKMCIPLEEMVEFFYKGRIKLTVIQEQEQVLRECADRETS